jgi:ectoine hydroxylase-related dioxygenase (phytanoyl-CoA dioxygenase family)
MMSIVYYVQTPPGSGNIEFKDASSWFTDDRAWVSYTPQPGDIIAFDGMLLHRVAANQSEDIRISLALNLVTRAEHKRTEWSRAKLTQIPPEANLEDAWPIINSTRHRGTM